MRVHGSCHCEHITFISEAEPARTVVCHCRDCQVMSGGPYRSIVPSDEDAFQLLSGELTIYNKMATAVMRGNWHFVIAVAHTFTRPLRLVLNLVSPDLLACVPECSRKLPNLCQRFRSGAIRVCPGSMNLARFG